MQARVPQIAITVARSFVAAAAFGYLFDLWHQTRDHLTNGPDGRPFGDDFINYWSAAYLALHGRAAEIYDLRAFHAFQETIVGSPLDGYHYSYPPVMLLLTAPFALIPYVPALFVWLSASWYAFYRALKHVMQDRGALLLALAAPAVLINAVGGQNGCWTAALFGGGLSLLERRPYLAGSLFGLMIYKPHLALLLPVALIAGRQWRTLIAAGVTAGALVAASVAIFGSELWALFFRNAKCCATSSWKRTASCTAWSRCSWRRAARCLDRGGHTSSRRCSAWPLAWRSRRCGSRMRRPASRTPCCCSAPVSRRRICRITIWCSARWRWPGCGSSR